MKNELHQSGSLYLRQHANNPVHWQLWSADVLAQAVKDERLLLLSIGYSCSFARRPPFFDLERAIEMLENNRAGVCLRFSLAASQNQLIYKWKPLLGTFDFFGSKGQLREKHKL